MEDVRSDRPARAPKNAAQTGCRGTTRRCHRECEAGTIGLARKPGVYAAIGETDRAPALPGPAFGRAAETRRGGVPPEVAADLAVRPRSLRIDAREPRPSRR